MVTCWEKRAFFQSSKNAASDPGCKMEHPWYRRDTVADSLDRPSERLQATKQQQNIWRVQEKLESKNA